MSSRFRSLGLALPSAASLALLVSGAPPARAAEPYLVEDIHAGYLPADSRPRELAGRIRFATFLADGRTKNELWRSDGTPRGTNFLSETCGGDCADLPFLLANTPRGVFYAVPFQGRGELWMTKGRPGDVVRLAGSRYFEIRRADAAVWVEELGLLFFVAGDQEAGAELWTSDGTVAGTRRLDLAPGRASSRPASLTAVGGRLYFTAFAGDGGSGLWVSDGTAAGTRQLRSFGPQSLRDRPNAFAAAGSRLVFFAPTPGKGYALWRSDGTETGTVFVADPVRGPGDPGVQVLHPGGRLAFFFLSTSRGEQLWATDGTASGTRPLTLPALRPVASPQPSRSTLVPAGDGRRFYFTGQRRGHGFEPWITDGTPAGTRQVAEVCPGTCSGAKSFLAAGLGGRVLFWGDTPGSGIGLWATAGTAATTRRLTGEEVEPHLSFLDGYTATLPAAIAGGRLFFPAIDAGHGTELWSTDGTREGTKLVADVDPSDRSDSRPTELRVAGDRLFFQADDGDGFLLWSSDGTEAGTHRAEEGPAPAPGSPRLLLDLEPLGDSLYYTRYDDRAGSLWKSDGTEAIGLPLPPSALQILDLKAAAGRMFFTVIASAVQSLELWKSDGTYEGTERVSSLGERVALGGMMGWKDHLFFSLRVPAANGIRIELWKSDGTEAGTVRVRELSRDPEAGLAIGLSPQAGGLYFVLPGSTSEVWRSDGTEAGTVPIFSAPRSPFFVPAFVPLGARLVVFAGDEVWVTDGTSAGSAKIQAAGAPRPDGVVPPAEAAGVVYYSGFASDPFSQLSVWRTDGTEAGTRKILDADGNPVDDPTALRGFDGQLYASAEHGPLQALWAVAAPGAPARVAKDLGARPTSGSLDRLAVAGDHLFFTADSPGTGIELWALGEE